MAHILLWDDEEEVRKTITMILVAAGHRVTDCLERELLATVSALLSKRPI